MTKSIAGHDSTSTQRRVLIDPRHGDIEDDTSSPNERSLLAIAGTLLIEISLPKLVFAAAFSLMLPAALLGIAPLMASAWLTTLSEHLVALTQIGAALVLLVLLAVGWIGWWPLFRIAEANFWALNALAVQPAYTFGREALRHLAERLFGRHASATQRARLRGASAAGAAIIICGCAVTIAVLVWPASRWIGSMADFLTVRRLLITTIFNSVMLVSAYLAIASLVWGIADATMDQPFDLATFDTAPSGSRRWRIAHLSDIHVVGERYGFRIESGRSGPRGNERLMQVMARIAAIDSARPLDLLLVSGDMTDAGRATEWAEFLDAMEQYPTLAARMVVLPGNHDVNIVDRANPARLDLPFSAGKRLRQMRTLSAIAELQGNRVCVISARSGQPAQTLNQALTPHRMRIAALAESGGLRRAAELGGVFDSQFPMILPPDTEDGLGVALLNSNAQTHFSFTNALGLISVEQAQRLTTVIAGYPKARWLIALHHHLIEYPMPVLAFSERIGTALVNGSWFIRKLKPFAGRVIVMHGHRHIDWIGACGTLKIISGPSPVMGARDDMATHFYIHTLAAGPNGQLCLLAPERVKISAQPARSAG